MEERQREKTALQNAILLGILCTIAYFLVYTVRSILGAVTPAIIESGAFSTEQIGSLTFAFFIAYAIGQFVNGILGDYLKAKYMISLGLFLSGVFHFLFPIVAKSWPLVFLSYTLVGFFLSMIYAPMVRLVAENTTLLYATRCSIGYSFGSYLGSPMAGLLAVWFTWQNVCYLGSASILIMGILCFLIFLILEKKKVVQYHQPQKRKTQYGGIRLLLKRQIIKFIFVSILTGIVRTTVVFWMPTYISQYLTFSPETSALLFTVATLLISVATFIGIFLYELLKHNMDKTLTVSFLVSAFSFASIFFIKQPIINISLLILAIMASNCAATMLWSVYCPGLEDTGMVSSATGFLDFVGYVAAAISSVAFANAVSGIGWKGLILVWFGLMFIGVLISLPNRFFKRHTEKMPEDSESSVK